MLKDQQDGSWYYDLYTAYKYQEEGNIEKAFHLLRKIYECSSFDYDKDIYDSYETYIIEKVTFLKTLAKLSMEVTKKPQRSLPYLDEALIILDGHESVHPYINPKEIQKLKDFYIDQLQQKLKRSFMCLRTHKVLFL